MRGYWFIECTLVLLVLFACSDRAHPRDLTISDQQQQAVYVICEKAARSPANSLDELVDIGIFCRSWRDMMAKNNLPPPPPATNQDK